MNLAAPIFPERSIELRNFFISTEVVNRNTHPVVEAAGHSHFAAAHGKMSTGSASGVDRTYIDIALEHNLTAGDTESTIGHRKVGVEGNDTGVDIKFTAGNDQCREAHLARTAVDNDPAGIICSSGNSLCSLVVGIILDIVGKIIMDPFVAGS